MTHLRTRHEIQSTKDDLNKLPIRVDERLSRHVNSTEEQNANLREEKDTELNVAKQEIRTFMQDVKKIIRKCETVSVSQS